MKRLACALSVISAAALIAGCGASHGTVTRKEFTPAHSETHLQCSSMGSNPCATQIPVSSWVSECWHIEFHDRAEDEDGDACVSKDQYDKIQIGQTYSENDDSEDGDA